MWLEIKLNNNKNEKIEGQTINDSSMSQLLLDQLLLSQLLRTWLIVYMNQPLRSFLQSGCVVPPW